MRGPQWDARPAAHQHVQYPVTATAMSLCIPARGRLGSPHWPHGDTVTISLT